MLRMRMRESERERAIRSEASLSCCCCLLLLRSSPMPLPRPAAVSPRARRSACVQSPQAASPAALAARRTDAARCPLRAQRATGPTCDRPRVSLNPRPITHPAPCVPSSLPSPSPLPPPAAAVAPAVPPWEAQVGKPAEEDLANWAHHLTMENLPDEAMRVAARAGARGHTTRSPLHNPAHHSSAPHCSPSRNNQI